MCLSNTFAPLHGTSFGPQGHNLNKLGRGLLGYAIYYVMLLVVSDKKIFSILPHLRLCKTCDPKVDHFGLREIII